MRIRILLIIFIYLVLGNVELFAPPMKTNKEVIPIKNWKREKRIDNKVFKIVNKLERICIEYKDNPDAIGWSPEAAELLYELKKLGISAIPALFDVAKNKGKNKYLRNIAINRMAFTLEPAVTKPLREFLLDEKEKLAIRVNAADLLGRILIDTTATSVLIETMVDTSNSEILRAQATSAFVSLHDKRAIPNLIELAEKDKSKDVRAMAAWGLGSNAHYLKDTTVTMPLVRMLKIEKNDVVRMKIIGALGVVNDKRALTPLINLLRTRGPNYDDAIKTLGNLKNPEAKEPLLEILKNDEEFRPEAAKALIKLNDRSVIPKILEVLPKMPKRYENQIIESLDRLERGGER